VDARKSSSLPERVATVPLLSFFPHESPTNTLCSPHSFVDGGRKEIVRFELEGTTGLDLRVALPRSSCRRLESRLRWSHFGEFVSAAAGTFESGTRVSYSAHQNPSLGNRHADFPRSHPSSLSIRRLPRFRRRLLLVHLHRTVIVRLPARRQLRPPSRQLPQLTVTWNPPRSFHRCPHRRYQRVHSGLWNTSERPTAPTSLQTINT
jgi:hypothetical protein